MKSVLISMRPRWVEKIASGKKTIEVRKTAPREVPFKCYIYCTKDKYYPFDIDEGKVIGEFICDKLYEFTYNCNVGEYNIGKGSLKRTCLSYSKLKAYGKVKTLYGWYISDLKIYDKSKELSEFISPMRAKNCVALCKNGICSDGKYEELCDVKLRCEYKKVTRAPRSSWCYVEEI